MLRKQVGVRALQQNASEVVKRAAAGEIIDITDRGRLVARIVPAHVRGMAALRSAGLVREATRLPAELPPPLALEPGQPTLGEILAKQREHER
jgi:prevent-host-death family protein